ncbi:unnamed protein product [Polarella glacialis]|uniref:Uncharacterized protein n=1 Tax=Polarella glacialis TaxID=89957 RepID=A0A813IAH1_POLGL|nr:unnamed protein product [Polarella glacialis]CAE8647375.1 unnamed protein product [Polarella glacialis]
MRCGQFPAWSRPSKRVPNHSLCKARTGRRVPAAFSRSRMCILTMARSSLDGLRTSLTRSSRTTSSSLQATWGTLSTPSSVA